MFIEKLKKELMSELNLSWPEENEVSRKKEGNCLENIKYLIPSIIKTKETEHTKNTRKLFVDLPNKRE